MKLPLESKTGLHNFLKIDANNSIILIDEPVKEDYLEYLQFFLDDGSSFTSLIEHYKMI